MYRPTIHEYFTVLAMHASSRGSCLRRRVGCILVDKYNHVLSTGYNGPPAGEINCIDSPCEGARAPSGQSLNLCRATHAEHNALLQCPNIYKIRTAYVTASPCTTCIEKLSKTSCTNIIYLQEYPHTEAIDSWRKSGRSIQSIFDVAKNAGYIQQFQHLYGFI